MSAPIGNEFWKARSSHGRAPLFASADALWSACCEYFDWVEANPLYETRAFGSKDGPQTIRIPKMRAMTVAGLCIFLDISRQAWTEYRVREGYGDVCSRVDEVIRTQKFEGASAELLNPAIIARDLGLADKSEQSGPNGGAIKTETIQRIELVAAPFPPDHPAFVDDK
jgi:hypothetical protein